MCKYIGVVAELYGLEPFCGGIFLGMKCSGLLLVLGKSRSLTNNKVVVNTEVSVLH